MTPTADTLRILAMEDLAKERNELFDKIEELKDLLYIYDREISNRSAPIMGRKLLETEKAHGSYKLNVEGQTVQCEIRQTIKWDSDKLKEIAAQVPEADAALIFDVTLSVSAEQLEALEECEHPALGQILAARTVKLSPLSARPVAPKAS